MDLLPFNNRPLKAARDLKLIPRDDAIKKHLAKGKKIFKFVKVFAGLGILHQMMNLQLIRNKKRSITRRTNQNKLAKCLKI